MRITPITTETALYVAEHMCEWDRREIFATRWTDSYLDLVVDCMNHKEYSFCLWSDKPVVIVGAHPLWEGVWTMWMYATDHKKEIARPALKWARKCFIPSILDVGAHRIMCKSMEGHDVAHRFLRFLGAERESTHKLYGKGGETFHSYAILRDRG